MDYRDYFVGVNEFVLLKNGGNVTAIHFDNGATTPPMKEVVKAIDANLNHYSSIGRGAGQKAEYCTEMFEAARTDILSFFHLKPDGDHTVIYVKSATEGINMLASVLTLGTDACVLVTRMEHHANDLPWRKYAKEVDYVDVDTDGRIHLSKIEEKLRRHRGGIKYVAVTGASNVTGYVNDIHRIAVLAHRYGAKIVVDAAQLVAHREINMKGRNHSEQIDFLVFSAHKAYAPFGSGAVVGLSSALNRVEPFLVGGSSVAQVFDKSEIWLDVPERMEAGTQNYFGVIAMAEALNMLKKVGFANIVQHENELRNYLVYHMSKMPHVKMYGDIRHMSDRLGIIPFNVEGMEYDEVTACLADDVGIATRGGKFCAHPYVMRLLGLSNTEDNASIQDDSGLVRLSLGLYNNKKEADIFLTYLDGMRK